MDLQRVMLLLRISIQYIERKIEIMVLIISYDMIMT